MGAVGRGQRGALLALEIIVQDEFAVVLGKDQVDAGSLEIPVEQKLRVGNDDRVRGRVRGQMIDVDDTRGECAPGPSEESVASNLPT